MNGIVKGDISVSYARKDNVFVEVTIIDIK
jgi:hypothetical protein